MFKNSKMMRIINQAKNKKHILLFSFLALTTLVIVFVWSCMFFTGKLNFSEFMHIQCGMINGVNAHS